MDTDQGADLSSPGQEDEDLQVLMQELCHLQAKYEVSWALLCPALVPCHPQEGQKLGQSKTALRRPGQGGHRRGVRPGRKPQGKEGGAVTTSFDLSSPLTSELGPVAGGAAVAIPIHLSAQTHNVLLQDCHPSSGWSLVLPLLGPQAAGICGKE
jgi:hypothetical protein